MWSLENRRFLELVFRKGALNYLIPRLLQLKTKGHNEIKHPGPFPNGWPSEQRSTGLQIGRAAQRHLCFHKGDALLQTENWNEESTQVEIPRFCYFCQNKFMTTFSHRNGPFPICGKSCFSSCTSASVWGGGGRSWVKLNRDVFRLPYHFLYFSHWTQGLVDARHVSCHWTIVEAPGLIYS